MTAYRYAPALIGVLMALEMAAPAAGKAKDPAPLNDGAVMEIRRAVAEERLIDAGQMIDQATFDGSKDPRLKLLAGELGLARKRFDLALADFKSAEASPATRAESLQGQGLTLLAMGRVKEGQAALLRAVEAAPDAWRAWNGLGAIYDDQRDWRNAEAAYGRALASSGSAAIVLNNRGYSRLLQGRFDDAAKDFVAALDAKPDLETARTNLRLTLALKGDYSRSVAGSGDTAGILNNAGFAAGMRGDYVQAEDLLQQAIKARGQYFERAAENLKLIRSLAARAPKGDHAAQ